MPRIAGVDLPRDKRVEIGLTYIHGIGRSRSNEILAEAEVDPDTRVRNLNEMEVSELRQLIDRNYEVEGDLRRRVRQNIQRLQEIVVIAGYAIAKACLCAVSGPRRMLVPGQGHARQSLVAAEQGPRNRGWGVQLESHTRTP